MTSFLDSCLSFPHFSSPLIPYMDVEAKRNKSNRISIGIRGIITTKSESPAIKIKRKTGMLLIFNSIHQNRIWLPLKPARGRKNAYIAPQVITAMKPINP